MNALQGYGEQVTTLKGQVSPGLPVKMSGDETVEACADGNIFCGVATSQSNNHNGVQMAGYVRLPYTGTAPTVGFVKLAADAAGGVKVNASGREVLVIAVDTVGKEVGFIL